MVAAVGCILRRERLRQSTAKSAIHPSRWWPATLNANDYANPVAASELPFQKPVIGNSGSAFCSAQQFSLKQYPISNLNKWKWTGASGPNFSVNNEKHCRLHLQLHVVFVGTWQDRLQLNWIFETDDTYADGLLSKPRLAECDFLKYRSTVITPVEDTQQEHKLKSAAE